MDVRHMRQVLAIHRRGSFVKAADDLGVAQPTLSKSISRLEDELGLKLFDRTGSGAKVTPMGAMIIERAEKIIGEAERLERDIELVAAGDVGEVRIGLGPALRAMFLPRLAEALTKRHPNLHMQLNVERRETLIAQLKAGALDIILLGRGADTAFQDLVEIEFMREPLVAIVSPSHPLAQRSRVTVDEFVRHPNAAGTTPSILSNFPAATADGRLGLEGLITCNDDATLKHLVVKGLATAIANRHIVQEDLDSGVLVQLPMDWSRELIGVALMTRAASHSPILQAVVAFSQEIGRSLTRAK